MNITHLKFEYIGKKALLNKTNAEDIEVVIRFSEYDDCYYVLSNDSRLCRGYEPRDMEGYKYSCGIASCDDYSLYYNLHNLRLLEQNIETY